MNDEELADTTPVYGLRQQHISGAILQSFTVSLCTSQHDGQISSHYHAEQFTMTAFDSLDEAVDYVNGIASAAHQFMNFSHPQQVDLEEAGL